MGVRPWRTRSATAGAGSRRAGTPGHRTLSAVRPGRLAARATLDQRRSSHCRRCPRLVAWREQVAPRAAGRLRRPGVLGPARPGLRRPAGPGRGGGAGARPPTAATGPAASSPATARGTGCSRPCGGPGWPTSPRASPSTTASSCRGAYVLRRGALRAAAEQAHAGRARRRACPTSAASSACSRELRVIVALGQFAYQVLADELGTAAPAPRSATGSRPSCPTGAPCCARTTRASRTPSPGG